MSSIAVNGGNVVYEILGDAGDLIALTPGGRFSKDIPGLRPLAEALVAGLRRLLDDSPGVMFVTDTYVSRPEYFS